MAKLILLLFLVFHCAYQILGVPVDTANSLVVSSTAKPDPPDESKKEGPEIQKVPSTPQIYQMRVNSKIANRFARTTVLSKVKNIATKSQEATFSIVIPETAFIAGFIMEINGKNYTAYVSEKEEAKKTYDQAVSSGQAAAHVAVSARDSNRFTVSVNLEPESKATFYLNYEELLKRQDNHYEVIINLHPGQPVKDLSVEVEISENRKLVDLKAPPLRSGNEIAIEKAELDPRADIKIIDDKNAIVSFSPNLERQKQLAGLLGTKEDDGLSGQFVVQYDVERDPSGGEVLLLDGYFVHFFAPSELKPLPKHVVFILDTSSSMYGQKIVQLREAMIKILEQLNEQDKFNLVEFNSNVKVWDLLENEKSVWFPARSDDYSWTSPSENDDLNFSNVTFPDAYQANPDHIKKAKEAVSTLTPTAATDIHTALKVGLYLVELAKQKESNHQPMVIFLTDGDPTVRITSTETIISKITEYNSGPRKSVIFTLSFGNDADKTFLKKIATRNLGFSRHIYEAADAALQLQNFYKQISSPLLSNVTFKYEPSITSLTTTDFPIHYGGSEIVIAGFCGTPDLMPPIIDGWSDHGWITLKPKVEQSVTSIERLWAYLTVKQLLEKKESSDKEQEDLKKKALDLVLKYQFVTSLSSLVVVKPNATDNLQTEAADKDQQGALLNALSAGLYRPATLAVGGDSGSDIGFAHRFSFAAPASPSGSFSYAQSASVPLSLPGPVDNSGGAYELEEDVLPAIFQTTYIPELSTVAATVTSAKPEPDIFTSIPWLNAILKDGFLSLTKGNFKLGLNETISDTVTCAKTPLNASGHCTLLNECKQVHSLLTSKDILEQHFCILKDEYAGVCCPDLP